MVDFDNQDIRVVLSALAQAAGVNVTFTNLPTLKTTLHLGQPVPQGELLGVMRSIVESNGLQMTEDGPLIRIEPIAGGRRRFPFLATEEQAPLQLFTYRLKHASASQLAPILMSLFTGVPVTRAAPGAQGGPGGGQAGPVQVVPGQGTIITNFSIQQPDATAAGGRPNAGAGAGAPAQANRQRVQQFLQRMFGGAGGAASQGQVAGQLSGSTAEIRIVAEESTNSLLVRATQQDWELIKQVVESVDLRPLQVLIEVTIAEVTRTNDLNLGLSGTATRAGNGRSHPTANGTLPSAASPRDFVLQLTGGGGAVDYDVALNALATRGDLRVLSLPIIIAENNKQATINVGSSRPFVQVSQTVPNDPTGRVETIQYLDVGTTLTITPTINADGYVNLVVTQTANSATNEIQFNAPVLSKREATTEVFLRDGQTTVIGGLADKTRQRTRSGIPVLSWIPLLGWLFGNTQSSDVTSELYLFLTPHIITADADIDRLRDSVKQSSPLLQHVPIEPIVPPRARDTLRVPPARPDTTTRPRADSLGRGHDG